MMNSNPQSMKKIPEDSNQIKELTSIIQNLASTVQSLSTQVGSLSYQIPNFIKFTSKFEPSVQNRNQNSFGQSGAEYQRVDPRLVEYVMQIPNLNTLNQYQREKHIKNWLGKLCKNVFGLGFSMLHRGELDEMRIKPFCSENFLKNFIQFIRENNLANSEIQMINETLKNQLLPYYILKYPSSEQKEISLTFSKQITEKDNFENNDNDLIYKFQENKQVKFRMKEDGNYNQEIMQFLNFIISLPNKEIENSDFITNSNGSHIHTKKSEIKLGPQKSPLRKIFYEDMENLFNKIFCKVEMDKMLATEINEEIYTEETIELWTEKVSEDEDENLNSDEHIEKLQKLEQMQKNESEKQKDNQGVPDKMVEKKSIAFVESVKKRSTKREELVLKRNKSRSPNGKRNSFRSSEKDKEPLKKQQQYESKVRQYTSYQIGQKISANTREFTATEIKDADIQLFDSKIMRIVTKWCSYLEKYFEINYFFKREQPFKMRDGNVRTLNDADLTILGKLFIREKKSIENFMKKILIHNYNMQVSVARKPMPQIMDMFDDSESKVGFFSTIMNKNCQSYLIKYLNKLIHGIVSALYYFQEIKRAEKWEGISYQIDDDIQIFLSKICKGINIRNSSKNIDRLIPELVTFKLGDILRCKCSSHQTQIIALYKEMEKISAKRPDKFKIIRVKNKLGMPTKDILINVLYRNLLVIEVQLAVKTQKTPFSMDLSRFHHFVYQLLRADFGPISELCSIWMNYDIRSEYFKKNLKKINIRKPIKSSIPCLTLHNHCNQSQIELPFQCDSCEYFHASTNLILHSIKCLKCDKNICFECRLKTESGSKLIQQMKIEVKEEYHHLFNHQPLKYEQSLPKSGIIIDLKSIQRKMIKFTKIQKNHKVFLLQTMESQRGRKNRIIAEMADLKEEKQFLNNKIILKLEPSGEFDKNSFENINNQLVLSFFLNDFRKKRKESIFLTNFQLSDHVYEKKSIRWPDASKINLSKNKIKRIDSLIPKFPKAKIVVLDENKIQNLFLESTIKDIEPWKKLQVLRLQKNNIKSVSSIISQFKQLQSFSLSGNCIEILEDNIFQQLKNLYELDLSSNRLKKIPSSIVFIQNLELLFLQHNMIQELPENFGKNFRKLIELTLYQNLLKELPQQFHKMHNLEELEMEKNQMVKQLPHHFEKLNKLKLLSIWRTNLQSLPQNIHEMRNLLELSVSSNKLKYLPDKIHQLKKLQVLNLSRNFHFEDPNKDISKCLQLNEIRELYCENIQLSQLIFSNKILTSMKQIRASHNLFTQIPVELFKNCPCLQKIDFSGNKITSIPPQIQLLHKSLKSLRLTDNKIQFLPEELFELKKLQALALESNKLTELSPLVGKLQELEKLYLQNNEISSLPEEIGDLHQMQVLRIKSMSLSTLPQSIVNLHNLILLGADENNIREIPQLIGNLRSCRFLYINDNKIKKFPDSLYKMKNLESLIAKNNHLETFNIQEIIKIKSLKVLDLKGNNLTDEIFHQQAGNCILSPELIRIDISNNKIIDFSLNWLNPRYRKKFKVICNSEKYENYQLDLLFRKSK